MFITLAVAALLTASPVETEVPVTPPAVETVSVPATELATREVQPTLARAEKTPEVINKHIDAQSIAPRGSFWWAVGVIVVAGIILAIVL